MILQKNELSEAIDAYLDFLSQLHGGNLSTTNVKNLEDAKLLSDTLFIAYDTIENRLEVINPIPKRLQK